VFARPGARPQADGRGEQIAAARRGESYPGAPTRADLRTDGVECATGVAVWTSTSAKTAVVPCRRWDHASAARLAVGADLQGLHDHLLGAALLCSPRVPKQNAV
jgi:hypothetical protein